ncbi:MAG: hypothetical protein K2X81_28865, partial [Candidatus Obscuribacterales bacterium]|nr:hypothetical protein [Candidatus Obscuribacterales bacterium]
EIDMGSTFPLKAHIRPYWVLAPVPLFLALLFIGGTIIYSVIAKQLIISDVFMIISMLIGIVCLIIGAYYYSGTLKYEITASELQLTIGGCLGKSKEIEPLKSYCALVSKESVSDDGSSEYYIILWHNKFFAKNVNLYIGYDENTFVKRMAELEVLLGLPVNPSGLEVVEIPANLVDSILDSQNRRIIDEGECHCT